jgi:hypothetical protein
MVRIGTGSRLGPAQVKPARDVPDAAEASGQATVRPASRALVAIDGGRSEERPRRAGTDELAAGRPRAGFIAHLLTADDPTLLPSRLERTRMAAACYAQAAQRLA